MFCKLSTGPATLQQSGEPRGEFLSFFTDSLEKTFQENEIIGTPRTRLPAALEDVYVECQLSVIFSCPLTECVLLRQVGQIVSFREFVPPCSFQEIPIHPPYSGRGC